MKQKKMNMWDGENMQYVLFSTVLMVIFILGMTYGLFLERIVKKNITDSSEKNKESVVQPGINNITPEIMNEWMNGKGGE